MYSPLLLADNLGSSSSLNTSAFLFLPFLSRSFSLRDAEEEEEASFVFRLWDRYFWGGGGGRVDGCPAPLMLSGEEVRGRGES